MRKAVLISIVILFTGCKQNDRLKNDWASLKRYAGENARLSTPKPGEKRVVFMGNSITEGWRYADPDLFKRDPYINRGISGQTTSQMLVRFRQDVIELRPTTVVILAGTNDIAQNTGFITVEQIAGNIFSMVALAKVNNISPVICSVLPVKRYYWKKSIDPVPLIRQLNRLLENYCTKNNIPFINYYNSLVDDEFGLAKKYTTDGVHPNVEGYKVMRGLTEAVLGVRR